MKKILIITMMMTLLTVNVCNASEQMAKHEEAKGRANIIQNKAIYMDKETQMCVDFIDSDIGLYCLNYCSSVDIDPYIVVAQIFYESRFCPTIVSPGGAVGLMQVLPSFASKYMNQVSATNLYNERENIRVGVAELQYWISQSGDIRSGLAQYNGGYNGKNNSACLRYADEIIELANKIRNAMEVD